MCKSSFKYQVKRTQIFLRNEIYREQDIVYNLFTVKVHVNDIYIIILIWCSGSYNSSWTDISDDNPDVTNADLGLAEDHFSHPEV